MAQIEFIVPFHFITDMIFMCYLYEFLYMSFCMSYLWRINAWNLYTSSQTSVAWTPLGAWKYLLARDGSNLWLHWGPNYSQLSLSQPSLTCSYHLLRIDLLVLFSPLCIYCISALHNSYSFNSNFGYLDCDCFNWPLLNLKFSPQCKYCHSTHY